MAKKKQIVRVDSRKLKLSNLEKTLYPDDGLTKAEIIAYYLKIAPTILRHIKGRPLTLIRYPDGINAERFFQKDAPGWAPDWIDFIALGEKDKVDYLIADEKAAMVWLANLASLEIHQMNTRRPHFEKPDYMVFDLDPPEDSDFKRVKNLAFDLKLHIENFGYGTFVKTTGGKGLHIVVPLQPQQNEKEVFEAAKEIAQAYMQKHENETTLNIKKSARKGRILLDIYRNRARQTIVSPYSLRGKPGAPVSMPLTWEELSVIETSSAYHLKNAIEKVQTNGDAWEHIGSDARLLHTTRSTAEPVSKELPTSDHHKSPKQLEEYSKKRDFEKTGEPEGGPTKTEGNRFVVHRHHASRLHYDLRLEQEGVLKSWAVPKGLPPRPNIKRLAVETEDHPLEYLSFEGEIPKEEYGGGTMWVFASGIYEVTKQKKDSLHFRLESPAVSGAYHIYRTDKKHWLLEKEDAPRTDWLHDRIKPMHGKRTDTPPAGNYGFEVKWDGIRALVSLDGEEIHIHSRNKNEITQQFPELQDTEGLRATCGLFDGEIVYLDDAGKPQFQKVISRLKHSSSHSQKKKRSASVYCYLFDCLYLDGRSLVNEPLLRRREWLQDAIKKGSSYRLSEMMDDGEALFKAIKKQHLEGIMAKKKDSKYLIGRRSDVWLKVKTSATADCVVIGYTKGKGDRSPYFGALHLAEKEDEALKYRGKVGTGFDQSSLKQLSEVVKGLEEIKRPVDQTIQNEKNTTWVEPKVIVEVSYASLTNAKRFRAAVFERLRPDLFN